jgi:hypothetical protein
MIQTSLAPSRFELRREARHQGTEGVVADGYCSGFLDHYLTSSNHQLPAVFFSIRLVRGLVRLPRAQVPVLNGPG